MTAVGLGVVVAVLAARPPDAYAPTPGAVPRRPGRRRRGRPASLLALPDLGPALRSAAPTRDSPRLSAATAPTWPPSSPSRSESLAGDPADRATARARTPPRRTPSSAGRWSSSVGADRRGVLPPGVRASRCLVAGLVFAAFSLGPQIQVNGGMTGMPCAVGAAGGPAAAALGGADPLGAGGHPGHRGAAGDRPATAAPRWPGRPSARQRHPLRHRHRAGDGAAADRAHAAADPGAGGRRRSSSRSGAWRAYTDGGRSVVTLPLADAHVRRPAALVGGDRPGPAARAGLLPRRRTPAPTRRRGIALSGAARARRATYFSAIRRRPRAAATLDCAPRRRGPAVLAGGRGGAGAGRPPAAAMPGGDDDAARRRAGLDRRRLGLGHPPIDRLSRLGFRG